MSLTEGVRGGFGHKSAADESPHELKILSRYTPGRICSILRATLVSSYGLDNSQSEFKSPPTLWLRRSLIVLPFLDLIRREPTFYLTRIRAIQRQIAVVVALTIALGALVIVQSTTHPQEHGFFQLADIKWIDGPASLPKGAKVALLEGNPTQEGPFTMRLQLADGFKIPPHWHPAVEHVTVISGTFNFGMGEKFDTSSGRALTADSFAFMPPGMRHFAWAKGETVVQVHGMGPWKINYVNSADDPRNKN